MPSPLWFSLALFGVAVSLLLLIQGQFVESFVAGVCVQVALYQMITRA